MSQAVGSKTELLNLLSDVKAKVQDKLGIVNFPLPQFILIGKQSVGKSRLIEALAGEVFTFVSGTLGSRRPTVLEFRNVPGSTGAASRWFVRGLDPPYSWEEHPVSQVMKIIGDAHEKLGANVSREPVYLRVESSSCVDVQIVDLPGFRDFALDEEKKALQGQIYDLVHEFMLDERNVMLCVEQAGDHANMSTLQKCKEVDPSLKRTVLIRNKLDKFYKDITNENVNDWCKGMGDVPPGLTMFAMTLPWWEEGKTLEQIGKTFTELRTQMDQKDQATMSERGIDPKLMKGIGFGTFSRFMENKIQDLFGEAIGPVLDELRHYKKEHETRHESLDVEYHTTDPQQVVSTTQACANSFAEALTHLMRHGSDTQGAAQHLVTIEEELKSFNTFYMQVDGHAPKLATDEFCGLDDYIEYLTTEANIGVVPRRLDDGSTQWEQVRLDGGAQWRRVMQEIEIYLRFSEIAVQTKKRDVIQARGVAMTSLTWRDVVVKLLGNEAHIPLQERVWYVANRLKWFFMTQKEAVLDFMTGLDRPGANRYSQLLPKHGKLIRQNEMIKFMVFDTYDKACERQCKQFVDLFANMLTSTFSNPWVFLKGATSGGVLTMTGGGDPKDRIPGEIQSRGSVETLLNKWLQEIPTEPHEIDVAVDKVQMLVLKTYSFIRSQVCDQVELFAESFFKEPMLRRLNEDMAAIALSETDKAKYGARRETIEKQKGEATEALKEINDCIDRLQTFKTKMDAMKGTTAGW